MSYLFSVLSYLYSVLSYICSVNLYIFTFILRVFSLILYVFTQVIHIQSHLICIQSYILSSMMQKYVLHYIFVPRINHIITSFVQGWNSHSLKSEKNWTPQQAWTNGMIDRRGILHIAEINNIPVVSEDLEWFGMDWYALHPADVGLATVNVEDVSSPLNHEQEAILRRIYPMTLSAAFGIDLDLNAMHTLPVLEPEASKFKQTNNLRIMFH